MKRLNFLFVLFIASILTVPSCKKSNDGAAGTKGNEGANGLTGTRGEDGSTIYTGATAPDVAKGINGDFYVNTSNGILYGPKTAAGWGTGFSLNGPDGATGAKEADGKDVKDGTNGKNGSQVLSGTGTPGAALGTTGDYYFDKSANLLYGPKVPAGWSAATNLKDNAGAAGAPGTANLIYSGWNYATNFRDTTADKSDLHAGDLVAPKLTSDILNGGTVQIYFTFGGGVYTLPYTSYAGGELNTMSFWPRLGHFIITRFTADNSNSVALPTLFQYRYVIIPGGITAAAAKHVNINDYESVRKYYRLAD